MSLSKVFPAAAGSGSEPGFWANSVTKASTGDAFGTNVVGVCNSADYVWVVGKTLNTAWNNTNNRLALFQFNKITGSLVACKSIGPSTDGYEYGNASDNDNFRICCVDDANDRVVVIGLNGATFEANVTAYNPATFTEVYELDTNKVWSVTDVAATNNYIFTLQHDSNSGQIHTTTGTNVDGGTLAGGYAACRDVVGVSGSFYIVGSVTDGTNTKCAIEKFTASTGASAANVTWYDSSYYATGDAAEPRAVCVDSSGNVYVAWTTDDADGDWRHYISKFNSSLTHQWSRVISVGSFKGRPTMCMAPDQTAVVSLWNNISNSYVNQLAVSDGSEELDLQLQAALASPYNAVATAAITSDDYNIYIAQIQDNTTSGTDLETVSVLSIPQTDFEAWGTPTFYGEFYCVGVTAWTNAAATVTTGTLSSTGLGTGSSGTSGTSLNLSTESVSEDKDTY